jgi:hypothetical protein
LSAIVPRAICENVKRCRQQGFSGRETDAASAHALYYPSNATVIMVNGTFLLRSHWEKLAGQTWSTRPFCRPRKTASERLNPYKIAIF